MSYTKNSKTYAKSGNDKVRILNPDRANSGANPTYDDVYTIGKADALLALKAADSSVVHLAGAETITGAKTFSEAIASADITSSGTVKAATFKAPNLIGSTIYANCSYIRLCLPSGTDNMLGNTAHEWVSAAIGTIYEDGTALSIKYALSGHTHAFSALTDVPTTVSGYGITDAYTKTEADTLLAAKQGTLTQGTNITIASDGTISSTDTDTHYTTRLYAGSTGAVANAAATSPYLSVTDDNAYRNQVRFIGSGATTVTSDASGNITISSTDTNTDTHWDTGIFAGATGTAANSAATSPYIKITDNAVYKGQIRLIGSGATSVASDAEGNITISSTDTNTHYSTGIFAGATGTATNSSVTSPYVKISDDGTYRGQIRLIGSGATTVTSDSSGNVTISSTDTNTDTHWSHTLSLAGVSKTLINGTTSYTAAELLTALGIGSGDLNFQGVVTAVPTSSEEGFMYKIGASGLSLTATNNAEEVAADLKIGDTIICKTASTTAPVFYIIPSGDDATDTWRGVQVNGTSLLGGAITTGAVNFVSGNMTTAAGSGQTVKFNHNAITAPSASSSTATAYVNGLTFDGYGHTTGYSTGTLTNLATNLYWANVKVGTASSTSAAPIFATVNGYTLAEACAKGVTDNSSSAAVTSTDTNLITARTLYNAGYSKTTGTVTSVAAGTGLSGGTITSTGTLSLASSGVTAGSYGPSSNNSIERAETFSVPYLTVDSYGRVTSASTKTMTAISTFPESYLTWGGQNLTESFAPIDAAMVGTLGANRLAFMPASIITAEYSRDSGSTWTDYGAADNIKINLFVGEIGSSLVIGKADSTDKATADYQLRVTIGGGSGVYTVLNKFVIYCSTNGSTGCTVDILGAANGSETTFNTLVSGVSIAGWSGYNVINVPSGIAFNSGGNLTQYKYLRFVFKCTGGSTTYNGLSVISIQGFGGVGWVTPSNFAKSRQLYSFNYMQAAYFPNEVHATSFVGAGTGLTGTASSLSIGGNSGTATALTTSAGSATVPVYFSSGKPVAITSYGGNSSTATALTTDAGSATVPVYFSSGKPVAITSYGGNAATSSSCSGNSATATRLASSTQVGSSTAPVYFSTGGVPVAITGSIANSTTGSSAYPQGFGSRITSQSWGNQDGTFVTGWDISGADIAFRNNSGQVNVISDGFYYQNEGQYKCLDTNNYSSYSLPLSGGTMTGTLSFNGSTSLPEQTGLDYILGINSFVSGGTMRWSSASNVSVGSASTATTATTLANSRTIYGQSFNGSSNVAGQGLFYGTYTSTASSRYASSGLQIRENGLVSSNQSDIGYGPSIGFHWANRIASSIQMDTSGYLHFYKQDGSSLNTIYANVSGNASSASAVAWSGVSSKPTTVSGYGITDCKITYTSATSFSITIGSHTITFASSGDGDSTSYMAVTCS